MSLKFIPCQESTIGRFLCGVKQDGLGQIQSLRKSIVTRENSIVLGKIVRVISPFKESTKQLIFLVKEVLPDCTYGQKFKAIIHNRLGVLLSKCSLETGDRLAFFEPFVFHNPYVENHNIAQLLKEPKYILEIGSKQALMWYTKKKMVFAKSIKAPKSCEDRVETPMKRFKQTEENELRPSITNMEHASPKKKQPEVPTSKGNENSFVRKKPQIQLPLNPQVPTDTKRLNPQYSYRKLAQVQIKAIAGDLTRINTFAIVHDVIKPLSKTNNGKFTIICKIVDESIENDLSSFNLHFFTPEDTILSQINQGDVLRLHRVKIETFGRKVDGRIFFSHDVVVFKNSYPDTAPITVSKNFHVSDEDRKRVLSLQKWYLEALEQEIKDKTELRDICKEGDYKIVCKVLDVQADQGVATITVTDGSEISGLSPSLPLPHHTTPRLVTLINCYQQINQYLQFQAYDVVYFPSVKAIKTNKLVLVINQCVYPLKLVIQTKSVLEINRRLKAFKNSDDESLNDVELCDKMSDNLSTRRVSLGKDNIVSRDEEDHASTSRKEESRNKSCTKEINPDNCQQKNKPSVKENYSKTRKNTEKETTNENELVKDTDNLAVKTRKALFTPNYTDLSDATDETSENLESSHFKTESEQGPVNPVNTGLCEMLKMMKTKYCSPRKLSPEDARPQSLNYDSADKNKVETGETSIINKMLPVVKLAKLTEKDLKMVRKEERNHTVTSGTKGRLRKRTLDKSDHAKSLDSLDEASTVVNFSLQKHSPDEPKRKSMRVRLESESTILGGAGAIGSPALNEDSSLENISQEIRDQKVTKWLFNSNNRLHTNSRLQVNQSEELPFEVVKLLLLGQSSISDDLSNCIKSRHRRMKVFLLDVQPDPLAEPLNMISGYCNSGCNNFSIFTQIRWVNIEDARVPHCPDCHELEQERRLELMLAFQLIVMDQNGNTFPVLVCREHAAKFMKCTVRDYLKNPMIRVSRCQLLTENTLKSIPRLNPTPLLDITLIKVENTLCLVSSSLKLPPCP